GMGGGSPPCGRSAPHAGGQPPMREVSPPSQPRDPSGVQGASPARQQSAVDLRVVVTNLAILDFQTPDHAMRLRSVHPGVEVSDVVKETGFELVVPDEVAVSREPS